MTDEEFDIIDELYFVTAYRTLQEATELADDVLKTNLTNLVKQGWVRIYKTMDEQSEIDQLDFNKDYKSYFYLASKKGLFEHNSQ